MEMIVEKQRETPVLTKVDVVVAGAGPAGFAAAIAAARNGAEVILIEKANYVGGMMAAQPIYGFHSPEKQVAFGIAQEFVDRLKQVGAAAEPYWQPGRESVTMTNTEMLKIVAQEMIEEAGVKLLFHSFVSDTVKEGKNVRGIIIESKSGRQAILADVVIDATGDGDVAARAGAKYELRSRDVIQPGTLLFDMGNVNIEKIRHALQVHPEWILYPEETGPEVFLTAKTFVLSGLKQVIVEAKEKGDLPQDYPQSWVIVHTSLYPGEVGVNMAMATHFHSVDALDLTRAEMEARRRIPVLVNFLKKYVPGFEEAHLTHSHSTIGARESRQIIGDYTLLVEDVVKLNTFKDGIAVAPHHPKAGHHPDGKRWDRDYLAKFPPRPSVTGCEVPYRCLLPKGLEGILVAGRCISATWEAMNAFRAMATCMGLGQAAGTAAAIAVEEGITPRRVDATKLRATLVNQGVFLLDKK